MTDKVECWFCHGVGFAVGEDGPGYCAICRGTGWLTPDEDARWKAWLTKTRTPPDHV